MHKNGDRVLVLRDDYWYPGTVRHVEGQRFFVICDDGDDGFFENHQITTLKLGIGDQVFVRLSAEADYQRAKVLDLQGDRLQVKPSEGLAQWVPMSQLRLAPSRRLPSEMPDKMLPTRDNSNHEIGDRVWACGLDLFWYPGVILGQSNDSWKVLFDFGALALVPFGQTAALAYEVGDRIWCRWQGGNEFFPGTITSKNSEVIGIHYDDDDEETTSIRLVRLERDDWLPAAHAYELGPGDRIFGCWFDRFWYPGIILSLEGKRIHILFDDNDQAFLTWDRVRPLEVEVGDRILCRLKGGAFYLPGEIVRKKDERIFVRYDDGQEEWTSVRLVRLETLAS